MCAYLRAYVCLTYRYTSVLSAAFDSVERGVTGGSTDGWELVGTKGYVDILYLQAYTILHGHVWMVCAGVRACEHSGRCYAS